MKLPARALVVMHSCERATDAGTPVHKPHLRLDGHEHCLALAPPMGGSACTGLQAALHAAGCIASNVHTCRLIVKCTTLVVALLNVPCQVPALGIGHRLVARAYSTALC